MEGGRIGLSGVKEEDQEGEEVAARGMTVLAASVGGRARRRASEGDMRGMVRFYCRAFVDAIRANDPAQHRGSRGSDLSFASSISPSTSASSFGARSLTASTIAARPTSAASSSSAVSAGNVRTPASSSGRVSARPPSRQSDVFTRSVSRAGRSFEVDDNVRIESLGFEGILRYLGEIEGKPGLWAGVELSGGFAGKGKNNGAVAGRQYFTCPPNCGVFVASTKLSAPTVGISRPSSVASTLSNGRVTPSIGNGRVTPSIGNGRVTPAASTGRRTPGIPTPSARPRPSATTARTLTNITPGSRASKYVGMTAKQLTSRTSTGSPARGTGSASPTRSTGFGSPVHASRQLSSPTRSLTGSPFNTPKALGMARPSGIGIGMPSTTPSKTRQSLSNTPRARIPSAIAMPPPASPSSTTLSSRSVSLNGPQTPIDPLPLTDLESNGKALQDRIAGLLSSKTPSSPRPESRTSSGGSTHLVEMQSQLERMQARLDAAEDESQRLRTRADGAEREASQRIESLVAERDRHATRVAELEAAARTAERALTERDATVEALQRTADQAARDVDKARADGEARLRDVQSKLDDRDALIVQLKEAVEVREGEQSESAAVVKAKNTEIALLEARVEKAYAELEEERRELGAQVDELRRAGQETIALYEERLSAADSRRYELEDLVASLEEQVRNQARPPSPGTMARQATSAAEIDNEMLRDQVSHLQKKLAAVEDTLEDLRAANERDEVAVHERIKRYKDREEAIRKELAERREESERVLKAEEKARDRVEEMEEALRENTVALENARAEIETLRNEIADLEGLAATASTSAEKLAELAPRANSERAKLQEEIAELKQQLMQARAINGDQGGLSDELYSLQEDRQTLQESLKRTQAELADERGVVEELRALANGRAAELELVRKKLNRDAPVNGFESRPPPSPSSKHDLAAARDEITGLKHIVQELQKENAASAQRLRSLEAENKLLLSETEQLREDMKSLEEDVERSIAREEAMLSGENPPSPGTPSLDDIQALQRSYKELKTKYETEVEQLRKRLADVEMKSARQIHDLNKEIGELESLIESKIYREDELEREVERLRDKVSRSQRKSSKTDLPEDPMHRPASSASTLSSNLGQTGEEVCEICERPGHDIFTCDLLKEDAPSRMSSRLSTVSTDDMSEVICEDCEERGHTAANCPNSLDVF
ncbi:uncharacterized protein TRAVEDRAFT_34134 [Trametes versicolor FP-101664 SS1]|uniref:uncharacterized protein n=1 Tax=Trametes versicolor (strain FP-101664) TaxID=717944 RepID=UPI0004623FC5|nr:uncharacterized protein TRAVEDRAFT_34134 [Trametes versicolor FP-101664 SS1]EIW62820.1 hypothetical protein TRAVEDRAFT_34134 [Trametes versicolor FP-101664 SS1]